MKLLRSKSLRRLSRAAALMMPMLAVSCQWMTEDYADEIADSGAAQYINITISVSASDSYVTRANPTGGEYGDGWEIGSERENEVENITLIFYQDANGINSTLTETQIIAVKKYAVHKLTNGDLPANYTHNHEHNPAEPSTPEGYADNEVIYSTGDQILNEDDLDLFGLNTENHVIVVANADPNVTVGMTLADAREAVAATAYQGTGVGTDATRFVMSSERDATVKLANPTVNAEENKFVYYFDCIHIERLAARIDYWAKNATYETVTQEKDGVAVTTTGYQYDVKDAVLPGTTTPQKFILTRITPFNLNDGNEYLFKRTNNTNNPYLAAETTTNWVVDPYTGTKTASYTEVPSYLKSPLSGVVNTFENNYTVSMAAQQTNKLIISGSDDIIIGYPKENTLTEDSPLYYYATGLAFEGYFIYGTERVRKVFYYFIRHQGENTTATATPYESYMEFNDAAKSATIASIADAASTEETPVASTPMNYGIVRNNIYRISIETVTTGWLKLKIAVHDWREVKHPEINI